MSKAVGVMLAIMLSLGSMPASATVIFESATGASLSSGLSFSNLYWPTHRFELATQTTIGTIGGYFNNYGGNASIFGAIIKLSGENDVPDSYDLTTADVLGTTLFSIGSSDGDYSGNLPLTLNAGWYAVAFGAGAFGADSITSTAVIGMPELTIDLSPLLPITDVRSIPSWILQAATPRFFVTSAVPEPGTLALLGLGLAGLAASRRRKQ